MSVNTLNINNYSTKNVFIWNNRYNSSTATYTNGSGSTVAIPIGTILGRIAATGLVVPQVSTATDGSQIPIGIAAASYSVAASASQGIEYCQTGDVDASAIIFGGSDTLTTELSITDSGSNTVKIGTINDVLVRSGINPVASNEMTYQDNQ